MTKPGLLLGAVGILLVLGVGVSKGDDHFHRHGGWDRDSTAYHHRSSNSDTWAKDHGEPNGNFYAKDPGVRSGPPGTGGPLEGLNEGQMALFEEGLARFELTEGVSDGLGPRFNLDGCASCHIQPATGGSSPQINPQFLFVTNNGGDNELPFFVEKYGPIREARFKYQPNGERDGSVHNLFVISGLSGAGSCSIRQPNFERQARNGNLIFRIPTPVFGAGLIEQIPDNVILDEQKADQGRKTALGIHGHPNRIRIPQGTTNLGADNTIARFGWKAQNKSLLLFAGEAYNVEVGFSNELFQTERDETKGCLMTSTPNDVTRLGNGNTGLSILSDIEVFAAFMRFLAPPIPSPDTPNGADSIDNGRILFNEIGCALCHTPTLTTGYSTVEALNEKPVNLYSDLLLHHMGPGLADDIVQGQAGPDEFRTAPLWGLGQRIFFLHDGRTSDLLEAIAAHRSGSGSDASEANGVVDAFNQLDEWEKQDLLDFLRSL